MNKLQFEAKLSSFKMLSTLPAVMAEIIRICDNPETSLADMAGIIMHDVALTSRILKIVNSPYYGRSQQISSIKQAVMTLGAARVKSLALSLSMYDLSTRMGTRINLKDFWRHSLNVACVSELIANKVEPLIAEEAFICGCIHDIGILVLDHFYPKEYSRVFQTVGVGEEMIKVEQQMLDIDHATAGEMLARVWNFPERYCEAIANHHEIVELDKDHTKSRLTQIINLADKLATFTVEVTNPANRTALTNREIIAKNLGLTGSDLKSVEYDALGKLLDSAQFLDMDVGSPLELLQKSTSQLYDLFAFTENMYNELKNAKERLDEEKLNRVALESLQAIIATFSHYLNNAVAAISGRTQLLELAIKNKQLEDPTGVLTKSLSVYEKSAEQITSVIDKLKKIKIFKTAIYHDNTKIIDFEKELREINEDITSFTEPSRPSQKIPS